jgi:hypothetical protein
MDEKIAWSVRPSTAVKSGQPERHDGLLNVKAPKRIKPTPIADLTAEERNGLKVVIADEKRMSGVMFDSDSLPVARALLESLSEKGLLMAMGGGRTGGKKKYVYRYTVKPVAVAMLKDYEWCLGGLK